MAGSMGRYPPISIRLLLLSLAIFLGSVAAHGSASAITPSFPDVPVAHAYYKAVSGMAARQIINGYSNGNFGPADPVIRQQFAKMIVLTLELPVTEQDFPNPSVPFVDLGADDPTNLYPHEYVAVCALNEITRGRTPTTFDPLSKISRQQVITMVVRAADNLAAGTLSTVPGSWTGGVLNNYGDPNHGANLKKAEYNGLLAGLEGFGPAWSPVQNATRGEVAQILWNMIQLLDELPGVFDAYQHSLAIRPDGTLWAWGLNSGGRLGDGTTQNRLVPTRIGSDSDWKMVAAGDGHTLAIKTDGTLWAWGSNSSGQLGDGTTQDRLAPTRIGSDSDWTMVAAGFGHSLAIRANGTLWAWGSNGNGRLGDGTTQNRLMPIQIGSDSDWKMVAAGGQHSQAIKTDGALWAWGYNGFGQLGDNTTQDRLAPTRIGSDSDWKMVTAGLGHTLAIKTDGTLWAWGLGADGRLGDGTTQNRLMPTRIGSDSDWKMVAAGSFHSSAIKTDRSLWAWGDNLWGQLGDGTTQDRLVPTRIGSDSDWTMVAAGNGYTLAIKTDGTLWAWGINSSGQLGDGTTQARNAPMEIAGL